MSGARMGRLTALAVLAFAGAGLAFAGPAAARCKTFDGGYVGFSEGGATRAAKKSLERQIEAWKQAKGLSAVRVGKTTVSCKPFKAPIREFECHAVAKACE